MPHEEETEKHAAPSPRPWGPLNCPCLRSRKILERPPSLIALHSWSALKGSASGPQNELEATEANVAAAEAANGTPKEGGEQREAPEAERERGTS